MTVTEGSALNRKISKKTKTTLCIMSHLFIIPMARLSLDEVTDSFCRKAWELLNVCSCPVAHAESLDLYAYCLALIHIRPPRYASGITDHSFLSARMRFLINAAAQNVENFII